MQHTSQAIFFAGLRAKRIIVVKTADQLVKNKLKTTSVWAAPKQTQFYCRGDASISLFIRYEPIFSWQIGNKNSQRWGGCVPPIFRSFSRWYALFSRKIWSEGEIAQHWINDEWYYDVIPHINWISWPTCFIGLQFAYYIKMVFALCYRVHIFRGLRWLMAHYIVSNIQCSSDNSTIA